MSTLLVSRLTDYTLGVYASRSYLDSHGIPETEDDLADHVVVTGVEDYAYASSLDYAGALSKWARREFRCASAVGQAEAMRAGVGIGVLHDFAARGAPDLVRILPALSFRRAYYLLSHPETHNLARIALCRQHLVRRFKEERRRFDFEPEPRLASKSEPPRRRQ